MNTFVLVNPKSRSGATGRQLPKIEKLLRKYVGDYRLLSTERAGDGERLARAAAEQGAARLVIAGGDGTVSEAVSGLLASGRAEAIEIGLLPLGTGRDFARALGIGTNLETSVARLARGKKRRVDAGRVRCRAHEGGERTRGFLNIASVGLPAESTRWLASKKGQRGPLSYVASAFVGLARYPMSPVTIRVDGRVVHEGPLALAAAANGQSFAGGMRVAPGAEIDDGLFDVVVVEGMSKVAAVRLFPALFLGRHVKDRHVRVHRGAAVTVEGATDIGFEADGEPIGTLPGTIEILPGAVRLCGLP